MTHKTRSCREEGSNCRPDRSALLLSDLESAGERILSRVPGVGERRDREPGLDVLGISASWVGQVGGEGDDILRRAGRSAIYRRRCRCSRGLTLTALYVTLPSKLFSTTLILSVYVSGEMVRL